MCLGPASGPHFPTGPAEEVELQVFPDATADSEALDAVGEGQVCVDVALSVPAWLGEFRAAWAVGQGRVTGAFALRMGWGSSCRPQRPWTASPACRTWPFCWTDWPRRTRISACCRPSFR